MKCVWCSKPGAHVQLLPRGKNGSFLQPSDSVWLHEQNDGIPSCLEEFLDYQKMRFGSRVWDKASTLRMPVPTTNKRRKRKKGRLKYAPPPSETADARVVYDPCRKKFRWE